MQFTIIGGQQVEINVGSKIKLNPECIEDRYRNQFLTVTKIENFGGSDYPFVKFFAWTVIRGDDGEDISIDEESAVGAENIIEVQT